MDRGTLGWADEVGRSQSGAGVALPLGLLPRERPRSARAWVVRLVLPLAVLAQGGALSVPSRPLEAAGEFQRPNVVMVMVDDLDVESLQTLLRLPSDVPGQDVMMYHLKKHIVDTGFAFTQAFVTNSLCCPSRATFLTGRYTHNHGVLSNRGQSAGVAGLDDSSTIATWMRAVGYRTGYVGKYLNGYGAWNEATAGYDPAKPPPDPRYGQTYIPPGWDRWWGLIDPYTYRVTDYRINENRTVRKYGTTAADYQTDVLANHAARFIAESLRLQTRPFFLVVAPLAPHIDTRTVSDLTSYKDIWRWSIPPAPRHTGTIAVPLVPPYAAKPSFNEADLTDKPYTREPLDGTDQAALRTQYRSRLEAMRAVDDLIGTVVTALGAQMDNTVLIFTSDNGYLYGEHRLSEKLAVYEESIRVPLYIRVPLHYLRAWGTTDYAPRTSADLALNNDLAPTIAALGLAQAVDADGRSLLPALRAAATGARAPNWRRRFLVEHWDREGTFGVPSYAAVRTDSSDAQPNALYAEYYEQGADGTVFWDRNFAREFYDLSADPAQLTSTPNHPATPALAELVRRLRACGSGPGQTACITAESY